MPTSHKIVGMHFHPPAKALMACLPGGASLALEPDFENPYDPNAIKVMVQGSAIPAAMDQDLGMQLPSYGFTLEDIRGEDKPWFLGFIARVDNEALAGRLRAGETLSGRLGFDAAGKPVMFVD